MSLTSFSPEASGDASDRARRALPGARHALVLTGSSSVTEADGEQPDAGFELAMDGGLGTFGPEESDARTDVVGAPASRDGAAGFEFEHEPPRIEPVRPEPRISAPPPPTKSTPPQPESAFIRTSLPDVAPRPHPGPAVAPRPAQHTGPAHVPAVVVDPPAEEAATPTAKAPRIPRIRRRLPHVSLQSALVAAVIVGGALEAGWIGLRVAKAVSETPARPPASAPVASPPEPAAPKPVAESAHPAQTGPAPAVPQAGPAAANTGAPPSVYPNPGGNSKTPVWVSISAPVAVEILEGGHRIGTSWGGGMRLSPGTHDLHIINRATALDSHQTVEIAPGTATALVLSLVEGQLRVETRHPE